MNSYTFSQDYKSTPLIKLSNKQYNVNNGDIVSIDVQVINNTASLFKGYTKIFSETELEIISPPEWRVLVNRNEQEFHSYEVLIPSKAKANELIKYSISLYDSTGKFLNETKGEISINENNQIKFNLVSNAIPIQFLGEKLSIGTRIQNKGNTSQQITIISKFPSFSSFDNDGYKYQNLLIDPFIDTIIDIERIITSKMLDFGDFNVTITSLNEHGDIIGIGTVIIQSLKSSKKFNYPTTNQDDFIKLEENNIDISAQYLFSPFETYQLRSASSVYFNDSKSKLSYSVDGQFWKEVGIIPYFRNTYLEIENNRNKITVGNIFRNYEMNLVGRGISAFATDEKQNKSFEIGFIDQSFNLIQKSNFSNFENGSAFWARINENGKNLNIQSTFIFEKNPINNEKTYLNSNEFNLQLTSKIKMHGYANSAYSFLISNSKSIFSGAGGISLEAKFNKILFISENQTASPYYPGIRRGSSNFSQRFTYNGNKINLNGEYTNNSFSPKLLSQASNNNTDISTKKMVLGISGNLIQNISFLINLKHLNDLNKIPSVLNSQTNYSLESYSANIILNYFDNNKNKSLYFNTEIGTYKARILNPQKNSLQLKSNITFQTGAFSVNFYGQIGEFYAGEIIGRFFQNAEQTKIFNINPSYQKSFFNKKLNLQTGISFITSSLNANGFQFNSRLEYNFNRKDKIYLSLMNYKYEFNEVSLSDFRIGITKQIPNGTIYTGRNNLSMTLYKDINNNNEFDKGDSLAINYVVKVNNDILITNNKAYAQYKKLPSNTYSIFVPPSKGWYSPEQVLLINTDTKVFIGLKRNAELKGKIAFKEEVGIFYETDKRVANILIQATDLFGNVYKTKTTENGDFIFFIPPGQYIVEIEKEELADEINCLICQSKTDIKINQINEIKFEFSQKKRIFKVQKFISPRQL